MAIKGLLRMRELLCYFCVILLSQIGELGIRFIDLKLLLTTLLVVVDGILDSGLP